MSLFWKKFAVLVGTTLVTVPLTSYLLSLIQFSIGIDVLLILLFGFALQVLVDAGKPAHHNVVGFYFIFLSVYASGAMAYGVKSERIDGWEWVLAVFDVAVVLTSTSIGTRCFYEAVALQRADKKRKGATGR